ARPSHGSPCSANQYPNRPPTVQSVSADPRSLSLDVKLFVETVKSGWPKNAAPPYRSRNISADTGPALRSTVISPTIPACHLRIGTRSIAFPPSSRRRAAALGRETGHFLADLSRPMASARV